MYGDRLGTDWEELSGDEAIRRAYALGVAAAFGYEDREEFDRLREAIDTSYDRSIVDLAYREGQREAEVLRRDDDEVAPDDADAVWTQLVEGGRDADGSGDGGDPPGPDGRPVVATGLPTALERAGLFDGGADLDALDLPGLLGGSARPRTGSEEDA